MKVYISGKVTGLPEGDTFVKFSQAAFWLKSRGYEVVNPLDLCSPNWEHGHCMRVCLRALTECDALCLLSDWGDSVGACTEYFVAHSLGMRIMYYHPPRAQPLA